MTTIECVQRATHFVDLALPTQSPDVSMFRLWAASSINDAYGEYDAVGGGDSGVGGSGPVQFGPPIGRNSSYRSPLIQSRRIGMLSSASELQGRSRFIFDPDDFNSIDEMPLEANYSFIRVQDFPVALGAWHTVAGAVNNADPVLGSIYCLPPVGALTTNFSPITFTGDAPANTGALAGYSAPLNLAWQRPPVMALVFYRPIEIILHNNSEADTLLYSMSPGAPMIPLGPGVETNTVARSVKYLFLASADSSGADAVSVNFSIHGSMDLDLFK